MKQPITEQQFEMTFVKILSLLKETAKSVHTIGVDKTFEALISQYGVDTVNKLISVWSKIAGQKDLFSIQ